MVQKKEDEDGLSTGFRRAQKFAVHFACGSFAMIKYLEYNKEHINDMVFYENAHRSLDIILIASGVLGGKYVFDLLIQLITPKK